MDPFDQFYKKKLKNRQYQFRESYWAEAESLIAEREQKRRRGWWWLLLLLVAFSVLFAGLFWQFGNTGNTRKVEPGYGHTQQAGIPEESAEAPGKGPESVGEKRSKQKDEFKAPGSPPVSPSSTHLNSIASTPATGVTRKPQAPVLLGERSVNEPGSNKPLQRKNNINTEGKGSSGQDQGQDRQKPTALGLDSMGRYARQNLALPLLPTLSFSVKADEGLALSVVEVENREAIRPRRQWKVHLRAGATAQPESGQRWVGGVVGLSVARAFAPKWSLEGSMLYRQRGGQFGNSQESQLVSFRFGRAEQQFSLRPERLHYLESRFLVMHNLKGHQLGAGISGNYLLGLQGAISRAVKEEYSRQLGASQPVESGWLDESGFRKFFLSVNGAYYYQLIQRFQLGLVVQFSPGGLLSLPPSDASTREKLRESGPVIIDFGIKYQL